MRLPWKFWNLFSTRQKKQNLVFYFPQCAYFPDRTRQNPNLTAFTFKIQVFCRPEWAKGKWTPWKCILTIFKWKNEFPKQLGLGKQMKKMSSFVWFPCLLPELWSLNCQKLCPFCIFLADVSNKSKAVSSSLYYMQLKVLVSLF